RGRDLRRLDPEGHHRRLLPVRRGLRPGAEPPGARLPHHAAAAARRPLRARHPGDAVLRTPQSETRRARRPVRARARLARPVRRKPMSTTVTPHTLLTHIALPVRDLDAHLAFWARYTRMEKIHERYEEDTGLRTAWLANAEDKTEHAARFVVVLIEGKLPTQI